MATSAEALAKEETDNLLGREENFEEDFEDMDSSDYHKESEYDVRDDLRTHQKVRTSLSGNIISLNNSTSKTVLQTTNEMSVDSQGLIHSGFIFGAAEYAAAVAVNEENLVIIAAKTKFLAPAKSGDVIEFEAKAKFEDSRKREIRVIGQISEIKVFEGIYQAVVLEKHILKTKIKNIDIDYHAR
ncbi:MAG: hotdog domain-containing protein [Sulfurospirillaceae bacterium]|nr:hotdog domain-containing protein [Sulfurospirillaceae bacterium]